MSNKYAATGWKKFEYPPDMITAEENDKNMKLTKYQMASILDQRVNTKIITANQRGDSVTEAQWKSWKVKMEHKKIAERINEEFILDFTKWLNGKSTYNAKEYLELDYDENGNTVQRRSVSGCPWGNKPLTMLPGVCEFLDQGIDRRSRVITYLTKLKMRKPTNINDAWMYYKYILRRVGIDDEACHEVESMAAYDYPTDPKTGETVGPASGVPPPPYFNEENYKKNFSIVLQMANREPGTAAAWLAAGAPDLDVTEFRELIEKEQELEEDLEDVWYSMTDAGIVLETEFAEILANKELTPEEKKRAMSQAYNDYYEDEDDYDEYASGVYEAFQEDYNRRQEKRRGEREARRRRRRNKPTAKTTSFAVGGSRATPSIRDFMGNRAQGRRIGRRIDRREDRQEARQEADSNPGYGEDYISFWTLNEDDQEVVISHVMATSVQELAVRVWIEGGGLGGAHTGEPVVSAGPGAYKDTTQQTAFPAQEMKTIARSFRQTGEDIREGLEDFKKTLTKLVAKPLHSGRDTVSDKETHKMLETTNKLLKSISDKSYPKVEQQIDVTAQIPGNMFDDFLSQQSSMFNELKEIMKAVQKPPPDEEAQKSGGGDTFMPPPPPPAVFGEKQFVQLVDSLNQTIAKLNENLGLFRGKFPGEDLSNVNTRPQPPPGGEKVPYASADPETVKLKGTKFKTMIVGNIPVTIPLNKVDVGLSGQADLQLRPEDIDVELSGGKVKLDVESSKLSASVSKGNIPVEVPSSQFKPSPGPGGIPLAVPVEQLDPFLQGNNKLNLAVPSSQIQPFVKGSTTWNVPIEASKVNLSMTGKLDLQLGPESFQVTASPELKEKINAWKKNTDEAVKKNERSVADMEQKFEAQKKEIIDELRPLYSKTNEHLESIAKTLETMNLHSATVSGVFSKLPIQAQQDILNAQPVTIAQGDTPMKTAEELVGEPFKLHQALSGGDPEAAKDVAVKIAEKYPENKDAQDLAKAVTGISTIAQSIAKHAEEQATSIKEIAEAMKSQNIVQKAVLSTVTKANVVKQLDPQKVEPAEAVERGIKMLERQKRVKAMHEQKAQELLETKQKKMTFLEHLKAKAEEAAKVLPQSEEEANQVGVYKLQIETQGKSLLQQIAELDQVGTKEMQEIATAAVAEASLIEAISYVAPSVAKLSTADEAIERLDEIGAGIKAKEQEKVESYKESTEKQITQTGKSAFELFLEIQRAQVEQRHVSQQRVNSIVETIMENQKKIEELTQDLENEGLEMPQEVQELADATLQAGLANVPLTPEAGTPVTPEQAKTIEHVKELEKAAAETVDRPGSKTAVRHRKLLAGKAGLAMMVKQLQKSTEALTGIVEGVKAVTALEQQVGVAQQTGGASQEQINAALEERKAQTARQQQALITVMKMLTSRPDQLNRRGHVYSVLERAAAEWNQNNNIAPQLARKKIISEDKNIAQNEEMLDMDEMARARAFEKGITVDQARQQMLEEKQAHDEDIAGSPDPSFSQFMDSEGKSWLRSFYQDDPVAMALSEKAMNTGNPIEVYRAMYYEGNDQKFKSVIESRASQLKQEIDKERAAREAERAARAADSEVVTEQVEAFLEKLSDKVITAIESGEQIASPELSKEVSKLQDATTKLQQQAGIERYKRQLDPIEAYLTKNLARQKAITQKMQTSQSTTVEEQQQYAAYEQARTLSMAYRSGVAEVQSQTNLGQVVEDYISEDPESPLFGGDLRAKRLQYIMGAAGLEPGHADLLNNAITQLEQDPEAEIFTNLPAKSSYHTTDPGRVDMVSAINAYMQANPEAKDVTQGDVVSQAVLTNLVEHVLLPISDQIREVQQIRKANAELFYKLTAAPNAQLAKADAQLGDKLSRVNTPGENEQGQYTYGKRELAGPALAAEVMNSVLHTGYHTAFHQNTKDTELFKYLEAFEIDKAINWIQNNDWVQHKNFISPVRTQIAAATDMATGAIIEHLIVARQLDNNQLGQAIPITGVSDSARQSAIFSANGTLAKEAVAQQFAARDGMKSYMVAEALMSAQLAAMGDPAELSGYLANKQRALFMKLKQMETVKKDYFKMFGEEGKQYYKKSKALVGSYTKDMIAVWNALDSVREDLPPNAQVAAEMPNATALVEALTQGQYRQILQDIKPNDLLMGTSTDPRLANLSESVLDMLKNGARELLKAQRPTLMRGGKVIRQRKMVGIYRKAKKPGRKPAPKQEEPYNDDFSGVGFG